MCHVSEFGRCVKIYRIKSFVFLRAVYVTRQCVERTLREEELLFILLTNCDKYSSTPHDVSSAQREHCSKNYNEILVISGNM